jgi:hypothetical protein
VTSRIRILSPKNRAMLRSRLPSISLMLMICIIAINAAKAGEENGAAFPMVVGLKPHYGFVLIHSRDIRPIEDSYPYGLSLEFSWHFNSQRAFNRCLCFPRLGLSTTFWDYDNRQILGRGANAVFFVEPYFGVNNRVNFSFRTGLGLAYANRPHDERTNPDNLSYSTRVSFALQVAAGFNFWLSDRMMLNVHGNYNHISNGGMREPNKGINYPTASIGLDYYIRPAVFKSYPQTDWREQTKVFTRFHASAFASTRELEVDGERKKYPAVGMNIRVNRRVSRINAIVAAAEIMGDWKNRKQQLMDNKSDGHLMIGVLAGNDFLLGRFIFGQQFGVYLYNPHGGTPDVFQRYYLDFFITDWLTSGIGLKAHGHVADFLEFRVGLAL